MAVTVRRDLEDLEPYDPDMREVEVMLSANENSYGLPPAVRDRMAARLAQAAANRYPEATSRRLRSLLARRWGVEACNIVVGNGGDELIFNLLLAFGGAERTCVVCPPTFSAYALYAQLTATPVVEAPRDEAFAVDEAALVRACAGEGLAFVTTPNNPTGNLTAPELVERVAKACPDRLVVVDEAYADFADPSASCIPLVDAYPNICVLKTLSKAYALAGARIGFVVAAPAVVDALLAVRQPYSVSRYDQAAAEVCVEDDGLFAPVVEALVANRAVLAAGLGRVADEVERRCGCPAVTVYPSCANFVLVRFDGRVPGLPDAPCIHERLASEHSVLVRNFSSTPGLAGCLRLTVGTPYQNARLVGALREVLGLPADLAFDPRSFELPEPYPA